MITILDTLILFSITPIGFLILMSLLLFFEYVMIKSIIKDAKIVFNYIKNHKPKFTTPSFLPAQAIDIIFKKKNIAVKEILSTDRFAIDHIKMNEWFS